MRWALVFLAACTKTVTHPDAEVDPDHPYPAPRADLLPAIGSDDTLEIATWNIENFPASAATPSLVADVIRSLDLDIVVTEEIADEAAWTELVTRLRDYDAVLSPHEYSTGQYQKIGVLYKRDVVAAGEMELLFTGDTYAFPRPALALPITIDDLTFELIGMHLKAGTGDEDRARRQTAVSELDAALRAQIGGGGQPNVVIVGDYNQQLVRATDAAILAPLLDARDHYYVRTSAAAQAGGISYLHFGGEWIDHVTTTTALDRRWCTARIVVPDVVHAIPNYDGFVSDHLPVVLIAPRSVGVEAMSNTGAGDCLSRL